MGTTRRSMLVALGAWMIAPAWSRGDEPRPRPKARGRRRRGAPPIDPDAPPRCSVDHVAQVAAGNGPRRPARATAPARSMPELFSRMGDSMMRDPARGPSAFFDELAKLEGPATQGVRLDPAEERAIGRRLREQFLDRAARAGFTEADDPAGLAYLNALVAANVARMKHADRYPAIDVTLIDCGVTDGQAFPGGSLVFTTALLREPDEATVAGLVAHELAHLDLGHLYSYARRAKVMAAPPAFGPGRRPDPDRMFVDQLAKVGLMVNPYRPEHEHEADCQAVSWMFAAGYDPAALARFFEGLAARRPAAAVPFAVFAPSHPPAPDRRRHVESRLAQLQRWRPGQDLGLYADNLRKREPRTQPVAPGG